MGPVDEKGEHVEAAVGKTLQAVVGPPGVVAGERFLVAAKHGAGLRAVEQAVVPRHSVDEGVHRRAGYLVDRDMGIAHVHRRLEVPQEKVAGVVVIDGASSRHRGP